MKISDLQKFLAKVKRKHGDVELAEQRYSDFRLMDFDDWQIVSAAPRQNSKIGPAYLMRDHYSLTDEDRARMNFKTYVFFSGN